MLLLVGLGNPGKQYANTRHNVGRAALMSWAQKNNLPDFAFNKKLNALVAQDQKSVLALPETYMNKSGGATGAAARFFKIKPRNIIVLHDDADLQFGRTKLSFGRRSAGHKGVESVKRALGAWEFWRLRIGIQKKRRVDAMRLVLQKFSPAEDAALKKMRKKIFAGLDAIRADGPERAMNFLNQN